MHRSASCLLRWQSQETDNKMPRQPNALSNTVLVQRYQGQPHQILGAAPDNSYLNLQQIGILSPGPTHYPTRQSRHQKKPTQNQQCLQTILLTKSIYYLQACAQILQWLYSWSGEPGVDKNMLAIQRINCIIAETADATQNPCKLLITMFMQKPQQDIQQLSSQATELLASHSRAGGISHCTIGITTATKRPRHRHSCRHKHRYGPRNRHMHGMSLAKA